MNGIVIMYKQGRHTYIHSKTNTLNKSPFLSLASYIYINNNQCKDERHARGRSKA